MHVTTKQNSAQNSWMNEAELSQQYGAQDALVRCTHIEGDCRACAQPNKNAYTHFNDLMGHQKSCTNAHNHPHMNASKHNLHKAFINQEHIYLILTSKDIDHHALTKKVLCQHTHKVFNHHAHNEIITIQPKPHLQVFDHAARIDYVIQLQLHLNASNCHSHMPSIM